MSDMEQKSVDRPDFTDLSVDIETLGTRPGSIVLSVAAVPFDLERGLARDVLYRRISVMDSMVNGLVADRDTLNWWASQPREAWDCLAEVKEHRLREVFEELAAFVGHFCAPKCRVWMKGPSFDGVLLQEAALRARTGLPWKYWQERCVRTICDDIAEPERPADNVKHDALSDAMHQARWVRDALLSKQVIEPKGGELNA